MQPTALQRRSFDARNLMAQHPPLLLHPNKRVIFEVACPPDCVHAGELQFSRWSAADLAEKLDPRSAAQRVLVREGVFDYLPVAAGARAIEWHLNFADSELFFGYGTALFAQDELQVAEHPALAALKEALEAASIPSRTVDQGRPTPVLVAGVERRCRVALDADKALGRPQGLYGQAFARATPDAVRLATTRIDPATRSRILAMAAPAHGYGAYSETQIRHILVTAGSAFSAAVSESKRLHGEGVEVIVHSGFWGCGAFGGHRVLMCALQLLAAEMAGLAQLVLHTPQAEGKRAIEAALEVLRALSPEGLPVPTGKMIARIVAQRFEWGVSDGN